MDNRSENIPYSSHWSYITLELLKYVGSLFIGVAIATTTPSTIYLEAPSQPVEVIDVEQMVRQTFPEDPDTAVAIAFAESSLNLEAVNPEQHEGCKGSIGLMQIACIHYEGDTDDLKNPVLNLKIARKLYEKEGWRPWGAYTNGSYRKYLQ